MKTNKNNSNFNKFINECNVARESRKWHWFAVDGKKNVFRVIPVSAEKLCELPSPMYRFTVEITVASTDYEGNYYCDTREASFLSAANTFNWGLRWVVAGPCIGFHRISSENALAAIVKMQKQVVEA